MLLVGVVRSVMRWERGENVRSLVDCNVIREDECAVEPGFEGPHEISISISVWCDRGLKLATRESEFRWVRE